MTDPGPLGVFQQEVASVFFELPSSEGFLLAGGAALVANRLTTRPTQDLDFFRSTSRSRSPETNSNRRPPCGAGATEAQLEELDRLIHDPTKWFPHFATHSVRGRVPGTRS